MSTLSMPDVTQESGNRERIQELEALFRAHYRLIHRTAYAITGSAADAEDVLQNIFLQLLRRQSQPDLKKNPGAYLYRAAVSLSLTAIRDTNRYRRAMDRATFEVRPDATDSASAEEVHRRLYDAVAQLDTDAAQLLILRYAHNFSDAQIAKLLGVSRTTVAVRLYRCRARLRRLLDNMRPVGGKS